MILLILIGFFSGIISGMGIGGGTILIPALAIFSGIAQHEAQGINLLYFIPTACISLFVHFKNKAVNVKAAVPIIFFGLPCALFGAYLASIMDAGLLRRIFGVFLMCMGVYEILKKDKKLKKEEEK